MSVGAALRELIYGYCIACGVFVLAVLVVLLFVVPSKQSAPVSAEGWTCYPVPPGHIECSLGGEWKSEEKESAEN